MYIFWELQCNIILHDKNFVLGNNLPDPVYCPNSHCGRCYRGVGRKGNLTRHLKNECGVERKFQCTYCSKRFSRNNKLKAHCAIYHYVLL